jgi:crotonobetainyl-CoA hydratase
MSGNILVEQRGRITILTINRPAAMNALDKAAQFEMSDKIEAFAADPEQWIAIITGAGDRAFCAGNDLKQVLVPGEPFFPETGFGGVTGRFDLHKPLIAAVNGIAFGGGFELALACDLVVAVETASFALPEAKVGLAAMGGGLLRLPHHVGPKRAMEIILTGERVTAAQGKDMGFINHVTPPGAALEAALGLAEKVLAASPLSIRASKAVVERAIYADLRRAMTAHLEYPEIVAMRASEDALEGPRAFAERRAPRWQGR